MSAFKSLFVILAAAASLALDGAPGRGYWTWDGFYAGINGGIIQTTDRVELKPRGAWGTTSPILQGFIQANGKTRVHQWNGIVGAQIGYNYQWCGWLFGVEGDGNYVNNEGHRHTPPLLVPGGVDTYIFTDRVRHHWLATLRARIGWISCNRLLGYLTVGYAAGDAKIKSTIFSPTNGYSSVATASKNLNGWTIGFGAEYAFSPCFSIKGEYLFVNLGSFKTNSVATPLFAGFTEKRSICVLEDVIRFGINYRFL